MANNSLRDILIYFKYTSYRSNKLSQCVIALDNQKKTKTLKSTCNILHNAIIKNRASFRVYHPKERHIMVLFRIFFAIVVSCLLTISGCSDRETPRKINLDKRQEVPHVSVPQEQRLRIAVGGMITPRAGFIYYRQFLDYIGAKLGMSVEFVDRENYEEINSLVKSGDVDVAFVCGGPYVDGHDTFGMELLAAPQAYGERFYYSYIIVGKNSPVRSFKDLRGKTFAFTDPLSNSGTLVPTYMLARMHETPGSFFKKQVFTQSHDKSIKAVAQGVVDGAAVDSLIWEYLNRTNPEFTSRTKVIQKSPPYGIPPVVVRNGMDPRVKEKLRRIFLTAHEDPQGREILKGMMIDKFVLIEDSAYDSIRAMKTWIAAQQATGKRVK
jgi:phosphonate transport system substrate-binding protein